MNTAKRIHYYSKKKELRLMFIPKTTLQEFNSKDFLSSSDILKLALLCIVIVLIGEQHVLKLTRQRCRPIVHPHLSFHLHLSAVSS
jgi:hypothetical protein